MVADTFRKISDDSHNHIYDARNIYLQRQISCHDQGGTLYDDQAGHLVPFAPFARIGPISSLVCNFIP